MESDISSSIEELESLHRMRQSIANSDPQTEQSTPLPNAENPAEEPERPRPAKKKYKPTITSILKKPVGELTKTDMRRLSNSLASNRNGQAFYNLRKLEKILLEIDHRENNQKSSGGPLKLHLFPILASLSKDLRAWKQVEVRAKKNPVYWRKVSPRVTAQDVKRLVQVITLLAQHKNSSHLDPGSYTTDDVPSFAVMIAADASLWESTAVDAALLFLDMVEKEEDSAEWDPRLIGAVMNALARRGMAEEAQELMGRALGVRVSNFYDDPGKADDSTSAAGTSTKRLNSSQAGPCYDALLRAWSKKAVMLAQDVDPNKPGMKRNAKRRAAALAQARHILLNHIPRQPDLTITNRSCAAVLQGYSALGMGAESEELLLGLEALHLSPLTSKTPPESSPSLSALDIACYNTVLNAYSQSQVADSVARAEMLFAAMNEQAPLRIAVENQSIRLALEKSEDADAPDRVLSLIEQSECDLRRPNRLVYTTALRCMRRFGCGEKAEVILDMFYSRFPHRGGPDVFSHISVLRAYERTKAKAERQMSAERAEVFFNSMQERVKESRLPALDVNACNILLNCYARAGDAENTERLLTALENGTAALSGDTTTTARPNSKSYSFLIKALGNSDAPDADDRAWDVLHKLGYPKENKSERPVPFIAKVDCFNAVLKLLAKGGKAKEAEALLSEMDELVVTGVMKEGGPNLQSYEAVLEALGRCDDVDAPARAEALVTRLEVMREMGGEFEPSLLAYNLLLNTYANAGMSGKAERLLDSLHSPDKFSVGSTVKALVNSGKSQAVSISRAASLAETLDSGNEIIFAHRLKLCSKFGLGREAEDLIREMEKRQVTPTALHYTACLNAWAKSKDSDAMIRAELLFNALEQRFGQELDLAAFHGLLLNYSARGNSKKARRLLQRILDSRDIAPDKSTFTMVINSYCRSAASNAGEEAEELLDQMRELHASGNNGVEPDVVTYASVIRCKLVSEKKKSKDLSQLEKVVLMRDLQMEEWPL
ncbi:hypothetical protein ACHAXT_009388 [Thalassiosira profunda]